MALWLKTLLLLAHLKDPGSIPNTYMAAHQGL